MTRLNTLRIGIALVGALAWGCSEPEREGVRAVASPVMLTSPLLSSGSMSVARFRHTATLLQDGRVLIAGGSDHEKQAEPALNSFGFLVNPTQGVGDSALASAELYDPQTRVFEPVGDLTLARWGHTATPLRDGRVLLVGGFDSAGQALDSVEIYDPGPGVFSPLGTLQHARGLHTATLLGDGRVLLVGGVADVTLADARAPNALTAVAAAEAFQPEHATSTELGELSGARPGHAAQLMPDGQVLIVWPAPTPTDGLTDLLFDPASDAFSTNHSYPPCWSPCSDVALALDPRDPSLTRVLSGAQQFDIAADGITVTSLDRFGNDLTSGVGSPASTSASGEQPVVVGGLTVTSIGPDTAPAIQSSSSVSPYVNFLFPSRGWLMNETRAWPTSTTLSDGSILIAGGRLEQPLLTTELLLPDPPVLELYLEAFGGPGHSTVVLPDGRVLFTGGWQSPTSAKALRLDVSTTWDPRPIDGAVLGTLRSKRALHQSLLLPSGEVLLAGGKTTPEDANEELFEPSTGHSRDLGFRLHARGNGLLVSSQLALFAGARDVTLLDTHDLNDLQETRVDLRGSRPDCEAPQLGRLLNGNVLVLGRSSLFEIDVRTASLARAVSIRGSRCGAVLVVLANGTVLIVGGLNESGVPGDLADLYRPEDGQVTRVGKAPELVAAGGSVLVGGRAVIVNGAWPSLIAFEEADGSFANPVFVEAKGSASRRFTRLATGDTLVSGQSNDNTVDNAAMRIGWQRSLPQVWPAEPLTVGPGQEVELDQLEFSTTWPEDSGGTTAGSATNVPIAVWVPSVDGSPAYGTFTQWSATQATWRVPRTPFPGLGILFYARSGILHPIRMVRIDALASAALCVSDTDCATGYCADGVCCDSACDGTCQACTAKLKGGGEDGVCGAAVEGTWDEDGCEKLEPETCRTTGQCDAIGGCAIWPEGTECGDNAICQGMNKCVEQAPEAPEVTPRPPESTSAKICDGDHGLIPVTITDGSVQVQGKSVACERSLRCSTKTHACLEGCTSTADCVDGFVCSEDVTYVTESGERVYQCVEERSTPRKSVGCSPDCRVGAGTEATRAPWALLLGFSLWRARRRPRSRLAPRQRYQSS